MFKKIQINDFRAIKNYTFYLGKYITMFSGWNATGKSTLLALLANSSELKKENGETYNHKQFRAEFSEILKGSPEFDVSAENRLEIQWEYDSETRVKKFRTAWQNDNTRFRVIPREVDEFGKVNEAKFEFPVIYLGLSRLYPLGETDNKAIHNQDQLFKTEEDEVWFKKNHRELLSSWDEITTITDIDITSTHKNTCGINATNYDWKTNSSGQDNISQILMAILSFRNLKRKQGNNYKGGLLIIDELEASLHPRAQDKIIDLLIQESRHTEIQTIFTTHSLTIMQKCAGKVKKDTSGNIIYYYFTKANHKLEIKKNLSYDEMKDDLLASLYTPTEDKKIVLYTEDEENRWFLRKLLKGYLKKLEFRSISLGCESLIDLMNVEPAFKDYLIIFDGDLKSQKRIKKNKKNFLLLPTSNQLKISPEEEIYKFLFSKDAEDYFMEQHLVDSHVKIEYFKEHDVDPNPDKKPREKYKEWFKKHRQLFDKTKLMDYWKNKHTDLVEKFRSEFQKAYNSVASKNNIPEIK